MTNIFNNLDSDTSVSSVDKTLVCNTSDSSNLNKISSNKLGSRVTINRLLDRGLDIGSITIDGIETTLFVKGGKFENLSIEMSKSVYVYTGSEITPGNDSNTVTVKNGSDLLTKDVDYTLSYENNIDAGTAKLLVVGKGTYSGNTASKDFTINKASGMVLTANLQSGTGTVYCTSDKSDTAITNTCTAGYSEGKNIWYHSENAGTETVTFTGTNKNYNDAVVTININLTKKVDYGMEEKDKWTEEIGKAYFTGCVEHETDMIPSTKQIESWYKTKYEGLECSHSTLGVPQIYNGIVYYTACDTGSEDFEKKYSWRPRGCRRMRAIYEQV